MAVIFGEFFGGNGLVKISWRGNKRLNCGVTCNFFLTFVLQRGEGTISSPKESDLFSFPKRLSKPWVYFVLEHGLLASRQYPGDSCIHRGNQEQLGERSLHGFQLTFRQSEGCLSSWKFELTPTPHLSSTTQPHWDESAKISYNFNGSFKPNRKVSCFGSTLKKVCTFVHTKMNFYPKIKRKILTLIHPYKRASPRIFHVEHGSKLQILE